MPLVPGTMGVTTRPLQAGNSPRLGPAPAVSLTDCDVPSDLLLCARWASRSPQVPSGPLPFPLDEVTASGRPSAIVAPVRCDESIKVLHVVAGGSTNLDDGQLAPGHKTFNRCPGHAEVVGSGTDRQQALASPLWLECFGAFPRFLPLFARR